MPEKMGGRKIKVVPVGESVTESVEEERPVSIRPWQLFRFATGCDYVVLFIGIIFAAGQGVVMPLLAIIFGESIDASASSSASDMMSKTLEHFGYICLGLFFVCMIWQSAFIYTAECQGARMRKAYFRVVIGKDIPWYDANSPAELPTRMAMEVQSVQDAIAKVGNIMVAFAQFIAGLVVAFTRSSESPKLTLVICSAVPIFAASGAYLAAYVAKATGDKQAFYGRAGAVAEEVLNAMRTVASFGGEGREAERYLEQLGPAKTAGTKTGLHMGVAVGLMMGAWGPVYAISMWFGAHHMNATGAEVIMVFFSVIIGVMALGDVGDPMMKLGAGIGAAKKMFPVLDSENKIELSSRKAAGEDTGIDTGIGTIREIAFKNVHFHYPAKPEVAILQGISLTITNGQKIALVGESGSGKSTVVQLLERFYDPVSGDITVNGRSLSTLPIKSWRRLIGYVGQEPVLFATSVKQNITCGDATISDKTVETVARQANAFDFLDAMPEKLETFAGVGGGQMSGGQKQRIAIARALVRSPQILLLDEATSALDNESEKQVQATIDFLQTAGSERLITISVAHRLSTIRNSDVIFFLRGGMVREKGTHRELMDMNGEYFTLVKAQESAAARQGSAAGPAAEAGESVLAQIAAGVQQAAGQFSNAVAEKVTVFQAADAGAGAAPVKVAKQPTGSQKSEKEIEQDRIKELNELKYKTPIRRLLKISKPEWWMFPIGILGCLLAGAVLPFDGYVLSQATEAFYLTPKSKMREEINKWCIWFLCLGAFVWIGEILKWLIFTYVQENLALRLRDKSFRALLKLQIGFFDDPANSPAGLTTTLERQAKLVSQMTGISLGNAVGTICAICTGLTLGFIGSWKLTAVCLALCPAVMIAVMIVMAAQMPQGQGEGSAYSQANAILAEAILNIRTVRALMAEPQSLDKFSAIVDKVAVKEGGVLASLRKGVAFGFGNSVSMVIYIMGFWYGAKLIDDGEISQADMYQSMYCVMFGLFGAGMAMAFGPDAAKGKLAAHDVFKLIDKESEVNAVDPTGKLEDMGDGSITFQDVVFRYPHRQEISVLQGLSFRAARGQTVALVGPSGSGKSTVIQLLQRFYDPQGGNVLVGGKDLKSFNIAWWRKKVALVGQEPVLFNMSLEENVTYGLPNATFEQVKAAAQKANMDYALQGKVKWKDSVGLRGGRLSGGQKQRCAIARAIIREPDVLLLDEATSALDSVSERQVQEALDRVRTGRTTFTIAHRLSTIKDSDLIVVVVDGTLKEQGKHDELMDMNGVYYNLVMKGAQ